MERPAGQAVYAAFVLDLLLASGEARLAERGEAAGADVSLCLDGRPRAARQPRLVTAVMDLGHLLDRRGYGRREWLAQNWRTAAAVRRSDHLLAPSEAVAFGLRRYLRARPERVTVLEARPGPCFERPPRDAVQRLQRELALPARYFVFVGSRARRKNLGLLAAAWRTARQTLGTGVGLVMAGPTTGGLPGADRDLGYVAPDRLPVLIAGAVAWLNPAVYEGSAVGALEAIACGTPPLVAGAGAQPRAVGAAGLVLDPHDPGQWAEALVAVATRPELRSRLAAACLGTAAELRAAPAQVEPLLAALRGGPRPAR